MRAPEAEEEACRVDDLYPAEVGGVRPVQHHDDIAAPVADPAQRVELAPHRLPVAHVLGRLHARALRRPSRDPVDLVGAQHAHNDAVSTAECHAARRRSCRRGRWSELAESASSDHPCETFAESTSFSHGTRRPGIVSPWKGRAGLAASWLLARRRQCGGPPQIESPAAQFERRGFGSSSMERKRG